MPESFEFDPAKSVSNLTKHGIDFVAAQAIWLDERRLEIDARSATEPRTQVVGVARGRLWSAFVTSRQDQVRIISVRAARTNERQLYESQAPNSE